jgi:hypothetical protein
MNPFSRNDLKRRIWRKMPKPTTPANVGDYLFALAAFLLIAFLIFYK